MAGTVRGSSPSDSPGSAGGGLVPPVTGWSVGRTRSGCGAVMVGVSPDGELWFLL